MSATKATKAKATADTLPFRTFVPTVERRLERIHRTLLLANEILDRHHGGSEDVEIDAQIAQALEQDLHEAAMQAFWLLRLNTKTLALSAPDDDQRHQLSAEDDRGGAR